MLLAWLVISCDPPKSSDDDPPKVTVTASELAKTGTNDIRTNFALFEVSTNIASDKIYYIGAKLASEPAPTGDELRSATAKISYKPSTSKTVLYLPFHIEGKLFDKTTPAYTDASSTMLAPNNTYKIYVTDAENSKTQEALSITTDKLLTPATQPRNNYPYGFPAIDITVREDEPFLLLGGRLPYVDTFTYKVGGAILGGSTFGMEYTVSAGNQGFSFLTSNTNFPYVVIFSNKYPTNVKRELELGFGSDVITVDVNVAK